MKKIAALSLLLLFSWPLTLLAAEEGDRCFCYNTDDGCDRPGIFDPTTLEQCRIDCDQTYEDAMEEDLGVVRAIFAETADPNYSDILDDCLDASAIAAVTTTPAAEKVEPIVPYLAVDIPNLVFTPILDKSGYITVNWIGEYVVALYQWLLSTAVIVATVMIMVGGVQYMTGDVEKGKGRIRSAIIGLVLLFGSYVILYTVNPKLTLFEPLQIEYVARKLETIKEDDYTALTGNYVASKSEYAVMADRISDEVGLEDHCMLRATIQTESSWRPHVVGHDENVAKKGVGSRRRFIESKTRYSGSTFNYGDVEAAYTNSGYKNDDGFDVNDCATGSCGLDTRFSHGIGLTQMTILTKDGKMQECNGKPGRVKLGTCYNIADLFDAETSLRLAAELLKDRYDDNNGDKLAMFTAYVGSGEWAEEAGESKMGIYNACITAGDG